MLKRLLALVLALLAALLALPAACEDYDGLIPLPEEDVLQLVAEDEDSEGYIVLPDGSEEVGERFDLLLIGTDSYSEKNRGRSDTIILVRLNTVQKSIRMVSFLRDSYVRIPGHGSNRINATYAWGGAELLVKTLQQDFQVNVDAYVAVDFARLVNVIDQIGGVGVNLTEAEVRQTNSILRFYNKQIGADTSDQLVAESGYQLLTGKQALCYSRIRKIDSDFSRTGRQRLVIEAAFHRVMELDMLSLSALVLSNMDAVVTDLTAEDIAKLIPMAMVAKNAAFESMHMPIDGGYSSQTINGMAVLVPNMQKNIDAIYDFLTY